MRQIKDDMFSFIDKKVSGSGLAASAIRDKDARTLFWLAAIACVGIKESTGKNDGKFIRLIQETVGDAYGEPYCIAGIMTCLAYAEKKAGVKSPLMATEHAQTLWKKTPASQKVKLLPLAGAIALWGDVGKSSGHGEIVLSCDGKIFQGVGFNTSGTTTPGSTVNREGNGVFYTVRSMKSSSTRKLLGFIKPF